MEKYVVFGQCLFGHFEDGKYVVFGQCLFGHFEDRKYVVFGQCLLHTQTMVYLCCYIELSLNI